MLAKELPALKAAALKVLEAYAEIERGGTGTGLSMLREATADLLVTERNIREAVEREKLRQMPKE